MTPRPVGWLHQGVSERRRRDIDRVGDMTAKDTTVSGRHLIVGTGETLFRVDFAVTFAKRPVPVCTGELDVGQELVAGSYPRCDGVVSSWITIGDIVGTFDGYFVGAWIAATTAGSGSSQRMWCNYSFHGVALRNPVFITEDLDDEI